jgi:isoaspartyl peptidase/L-asparaginase-like protein (Ntn-hydrolase superfamily)
MAKRVGGEAGCILLDARGRIGWWHNAKNMAVAYRTPKTGAAIAFVHKREEEKQVNALA